MTAKRYILGEELEINLQCLTWSDAHELEQWLLTEVRKPESLQTMPEFFTRGNSVIIRAHPSDRETIKDWIVKAAKKKDFEIQND
jgi:hypothetical protein